ncbi:hypothetical protein RMCBS344292_18009 [Rhizopus microsporus]|nr:hypothetical protein RMCBS344292_18009 [Rhizopus microsporus]
MTKTRKRSRSIEEDDANVDVNGQISQSVDEIQSTSLNTSTELLKENIKRRPSATKADTKLKQIYNVQKVKKAFDFAKTFVEEDDVIIPNCPLSIATTIKRACLKNYDNYKTLNDNDKNIVALGANGILDLSKNSPHKDLLGSNVFNILQKTYPPSLTSMDIFEDIVCVSDIEKKAKIDLSSARAYANKKESSAKGFESTIYNVYSEYLKILQFKKKVFRKDLDITEGDFAVKVWGPILESTMRDEEEIRLKWGDSVGDSSGVSESIGFKVDVRAVYDRFSARKNLKEVDTANVEMARADASIGKITSDRTKLFIENKCVIDRLVFEGVNKEDAVIPCLQITGPRATLYSVRLVANGLYVGTEERRCSLVRNGNDISNFRHVVNLLQTFRRSALSLININNQENNRSKKHKDTIMERRSTRIPPVNNNNKVPPLPQYLFE